ncbi:MAG: tRNA guanosine(34) transglycosylase Tgt [Actinobacteria bacterium]|jgi:queuine tRNA-ribosyltransferase|nr:tRNA guanosine(34) transglycosylase Tgt [Actinomycetota bacterium]
MAKSDSDKGFSFEISHAAESGLARVGTITTPHGVVNTPAFIPVGTKATVKTVLPEAMEDLGAQALLANAYHLYLQPGPDVLDEAGGLGSFMNWNKPTFTDSGGFQVLSLGVGFKKVLAMDAQTFRSDQVIAKNKERLAHVDDEGVTFKSHLDGSMHRFTAEISMQIQHKLGADIMFAFDECTTLHNTRPYQELAMSRTYDWAIRCLDEHKRLTESRATKPYQALFGVIQGAQYEDLRKKAASDLGSMSSSGIEFDGFGIGGALDKDSLGTIVGWVNSTLPQEKPKHLLGIGAPEDLFVGVENGVDTFDCVLASRIARTSAVYTMEGRFNVSNQPYIRDFNPIDDECDCYTCTHYTRAYLCHLFRGKEMIAGTLATIHNERFIVRLVDQMREALIDGTFQDMKKDFMGRYKHKSGQSRD